MSHIVTTGRRHTRSTSSVASTAGVIAERSTGSIQRSAPGMVMPVALAGKYPKASTVVRASNSQSNQEAGSSASSAHAGASYHGSTYGHAASQATTNRNAHPIDCPALCP